MVTMQALRLFPVSIIMPILQIVWVLFSIVCGSLYYQEYKTLTPLSGGMFAAGVVIMLVGIGFLASATQHVMQVGPAATIWVVLCGEPACLHSWLAAGHLKHMIAFWGMAKGRVTKCASCCVASSVSLLACTAAQALRPLLWLTMTMYALMPTTRPFLCPAARATATGGRRGGRGGEWLPGHHAHCGGQAAGCGATPAWVPAAKVHRTCKRQHRCAQHCG